jgi:hypothetical protein
MDMMDSQWISSGLDQVVLWIAESSLTNINDPQGRRHSGQAWYSTVGASNAGARDGIRSDGRLAPTPAQDSPFTQGARKTPTQRWA